MIAPQLSQHFFRKLNGFFILVFLIGMKELIYRSHTRMLPGVLIQVDQTVSYTTASTTASHSASGLPQV
jgi:hypothetical protein